MQTEYSFFLKVKQSEHYLWPFKILHKVFNEVNQIELYDPANVLFIHFIYNA